MELFDRAGLKQPSPVNSDAHRNNVISYSDKVKLNIKKDESSTSSDFMKSLHDTKNSMPSFTGKKRADGSIDVLFKSFEDANKAKTILDTNLKCATIDRPTPARLTRYNLVGIPFDMSISEIVCSIIDDNSNWLNLVKCSDNSLALNHTPIVQNCVISMTL